MQVLLHRLADSDLRSQLDYQDRITASHTSLRRYFYPLFFNERPFGPAEFAQMPRFDAAGQRQGPAPFMPVAVLAMLAGLAVWWGAGRLKRG
jgi:ABC-2 type transport system permease protein